MTLSLLAHAVLAVLRIREKKTPKGVIALSVAELCRLLSKLMEKAGETVEQVLHWSSWRRRHQYYAQQCHYRYRDNLMITECLRL
ncbi:hypothetical protein PSI15_06025 [Xenorhabdus sp. PR6a]|uniref:hypothetical protein n=1 Tax=Xenorhabdus sp. PR6a TaxID=3025877 RepID=UPI0023582E83|nr:hypothetical protein [Xenorhabdus sp. PR6a]MDC9581130.1 hypothetical protein [Xenorhabdus sp. PR6a]